MNTLVSTVLNTCFLSGNVEVPKAGDRNGSVVRQKISTAGDRILPCRSGSHWKSTSVDAVNFIVEGQEFGELGSMEILILFNMETVPLTVRLGYMEVDRLRRFNWHLEPNFLSHLGQHLHLTS